MRVNLVPWRRVRTRRPFSAFTGGTSGSGPLVAAHRPSVLRRRRLPHPGLGLHPGLPRLGILHHGVAQGGPTARQPRLRQQREHGRSITVAGPSKPNCSRSPRRSSRRTGSNGCTSAPIWRPSAGSTTIGRRTSMRTPRGSGPPTHPAGCRPTAPDANDISDGPAHPPSPVLPRGTPSHHHAEIDLLAASGSGSLEQRSASR
jgi:hypothetical protein